MKLKQVEINNFNSYKSYVVRIRDGLFNVWGLNGQGKTSLQIAIRLGLGWSPATRSEESLEYAIHENEDQCRITLVFDNCDNTLKNYPEEVRVERHIVRGDSKPRMRMSNKNGELVPKAQKEIREEFSKLGYNPDDPGIFIEQGDLRSFYSIPFSKLLEKCIGLAGLRSTHEKVKQTERTFSQIEEVKKQIQKTISDMQDELEKYRPGHDAHFDFCQFDEILEKIEFENKAIIYHLKRNESQKALDDSEEKKENLEEHKRKLKISNHIVADNQEKISNSTIELKELEKQNGNITNILDKIYDEISQKSERQKELEKLLFQIKSNDLPSPENAKKQVDIIQKKLSFTYSKLGKQQDDLHIIESQLADIKSGFTLGIVPSRQKKLKQRLVGAGIKSEFFADCLEIKKNAEHFRENIEIILDPFKFYLIIQKKDLQNAIEILKDETEIGIIVPDDWPPNNYGEQSVRDYLIIKENAPENLQDFLTYFILGHNDGYGPNNKVFLEPSIRFHRIHLNVHPQNTNPAIGEEGKRISRELAEKQKQSLEKNIEELNSEIKRLKMNLEKAMISLDLAEKKPFIKEYGEELKNIHKKIFQLNEEKNRNLTDNGDINNIIGELKQKIVYFNNEISKQNLQTAEKRVLNYEEHHQNSKNLYDLLNKEAEILKKDCNTEFIEKLEGFTVYGLNKQHRENKQQEMDTQESIDVLEKTFTRGQAKSLFYNFKSQKSLIEEKKDNLMKQKQQADQFKIEWDKAQQTYKKIATQLFNRAGLLFHNYYKSQNPNADAQIIPNFNIMPPELEVRLNLGKRKSMVPLNAKVGGASGGEKLAAIVNLIVSILKARSELSEVEPDIYRPQPFISIDEPQQDMDDPAFRNAILNFKEAMENTQIIILTHKPLPDPELWQLWVFLHSELGTIGKSHRGEINKLFDKNVS